MTMQRLPVAGNLDTSCSTASLEWHQLLLLVFNGYYAINCFFLHRELNYFVGMPGSVLHVTVIVQVFLDIFE